MIRALVSLPLLAALSTIGETVTGSENCGNPTDCLALKLHNQLRQDLNSGQLPNSPKPNPPVEMLVHDTALARVALNWSAVQCSSVRGHNKSRRADFLAEGGNPAYPAIGENIFYHSAHLPEAEALKLAVES
ncbi:hypothetical protein [Microbulbifer guangxiensis]|uniref:hypothetical protein n=1 Tax=Microbulbifer guangxiensis TaxID=2904249 RepID=UPI001F44407C|nr:hypothetical protein [Microbulbifer guangxiensis]